MRKSARADLRATLSMGGALRMLRDASHHERSNRTRMHVTALGCPQHEADDAHAARGTFRNPAGHFVLIVEAASQPAPHTRDPERMVIELTARDQADNGDCMRNPQRVRALSPERRRRSRYHVAIKLAKRSDSNPRCGPGDNFSDSEAAGCAGGTSRTWAAGGTCATSGGCSASSPSATSGRATRRRAARRAASTDSCS